MLGLYAALTAPGKIAGCSQQAAVTMAHSARRLPAIELVEVGIRLKAKKTVNQRSACAYC
jgi:hypothetical protein